MTGQGQGNSEGQLVAAEGFLGLPLAGAAGHRPVIGQGSWYKTGLHVLPEELNAAVLEALAAEAAGVDIRTANAQ